MKAGQILSFWPAELMVAPEYRAIYRDALARLWSDAPAMDPELARWALERELGPVERTFAEFDPEPLAAASVGQVHAARLHDGRAVAVKIQYPGAAAAIAGDLENVELLATFVSLLWTSMPTKRVKADIRGMAREVSMRLTEELDYRLEASNQTEFADTYRGHPFIHVPGVVLELCTNRVLCQELAHGISWEQALTAGQQLRNRWAEAILRFVHGHGTRFAVFHVDPHPGNYLFHDDGSVTFLDFGCVKRFTREQARYKEVLGVPCINGDALGVWQACVSEGLLRPSDPVTPEETLAYWSDYLSVWGLEPPAIFTPEHVAGWMKRLFPSNGPHANVLRHSTMAPAYTLLSRIEFGSLSLVAQLRPCINFPAMGRQYAMKQPPATEMGELDHAFFASSPDLAPGAPPAIP
jgi:predicted unusual protein kinase regulating ubiquinone biosynthesis (AarF/ABC1/UbiB family)